MKKIKQINNFFIKQKLHYELNRSLNVEIGKEMFNK